MLKGYLLVRDSELLINNPKYSDIEILCKDQKKLYGLRAILAARLELFEGLFYNGMKETYEKEIYFPTINSSIMEIVLEYIYTGTILDDHITKDNIIEIYYAADFFQLCNIKNFITDTIKNILEKNYTNNFLPELLTKVVNNMSSSEDYNLLLDILVKAVAMIPLNKIDFDQLSITAFKHILLYKNENYHPFATSEYEVLRYGSLLAAKQVSDDTFKTLMEQFPTLEEVDYSNDETENEISIINHQKISNELEPLIKFIDFNKIDVEDLSNIIEPLNIIPTEIFLNTYRKKARLNKINIFEIQETPHNFIDYVWDETECGSKLVIEDNGNIVYSKSDCRIQGVKSKVIFEEKGIFEWDVIFEGNSWSCIGLCTPSEYNLDDEITMTLDNKWLLDSDGYCYSDGHEHKSSYCLPFEINTIVTVHLDMYMRTCAFTINGTKYPEISWWDNLPSKLCPLVILSYPGRARIQPHLKKWFAGFLF